MRKSFYHFTRVWIKPNSHILLRMFLILFLSSFFAFTSKTFAQIGAGIAPVTPPTGNFHIDGNLQANIPTAGVGDWLPGAAGAGANLLNSSGVPINPLITFHLTDAYASATDNNFSGGKKFDDNPNTWTWVSNPVGSKVDINNALIHFALSSNGHKWIIIAADRASNSGDAYIDFEFLQNTLVTTGGPLSGGFSSAAPNSTGGRTVNDFALTLKLTKGGTSAGFLVERWQQVGTVYDYVDATSSLPSGSTFAAVNATSVPVSFPAFGVSTYATNTFVEAAVDLTALITNFNPCLEVGIKSIMVKTKESSANSATIVDFITPLQATLTLGAADAGPDQAHCSNIFSLTGTATPNAGDGVSSTTWSITSGAGSIANGSTLSPTVTVTTSPATVRLTVVTTSGCIVTDDVVLTVTASPTVTAGNGGAVCAGSTLNLTATTIAGATYAWTGPNNFSSTDQNPSIANATTAAAGVYSVTATANGCPSPASTTTATVNAIPSVTAGNGGAVCAGSTLHLTATTVAGATYAWTGPNSFSSASQNPDITNATTAASGIYSVTVTVNNCTSPASTTTATVNAIPSVTAGNSGAVCDGSTLHLTASTVAGATYAWTGPNSFTSAEQNPDITNATTAASGIYSVTVTVNNCPSPASTTTATVNAFPSVTAGNGGAVCAGSTLHLTANTVAGATYAWTGPNSFTSASQNPDITNATTAASGIYSVTVTVNNCTSPASTTTATVNAIPSVTAGNSGAVCDGSTLHLTANTVAGATYAWTGPNSFISATQNPDITNATTAASGIYSVTVTVNNCTSPASTTTATVNAIPSVTAGNGGAVCDGSTLHLTASTVAGPSYAWTGPNSFTSAEQNPDITNATTAATGIYSVTVTVNNCTSPASTTTATVNDIPSVTAGNGGAVCVGSTLHLTASSVTGATYAWTGPNNFISTLQNPDITNATTAANGVYSVTVTVNNCTSPASTTTATVNTNPSTPDAVYVAPTTCTETTFKVRVNNPASAGAGTYTLTQPGEPDKTFVYPTNGTIVLFENLVFGKSYSVIFQNTSGCISPAATCGETTQANSAVQTSLRSQQHIISEAQSTVKAYPNPFNDKVRFVINAPKSGKGILEIFDLLGQKIKTVYQGFIPAGTNNFDLNLSNQSYSNLIYRFNMGGKQSTGRLIQIK